MPDAEGLSERVGRPVALVKVPPDDLTGVAVVEQDVVPLGGDEAADELVAGVEAAELAEVEVPNENVGKAVPMVTVFTAEPPVDIVSVFGLTVQVVAMAAGGNSVSSGSKWLRQPPSRVVMTDDSKLSKTQMLKYSSSQGTVILQYVAHLGTLN